MINNFYDNFFKVVKSFPNKVALEFHGTSVSYAALDNSVRCFENNLIFIDDNYKLQIREETKKDKNLFDELKKYEGERISLPKNKEFYPKKNYLKTRFRLKY